MNNEEAKFLLRAYRPGGADASAPLFTDALKQAAADPALSAWFAHEQAHDTAIAGKLAQLAPPPGLRDAILAGTRASAAKRSARQRWIAWVGLAAAAAVVFAMLTRWSRPDALAGLTSLALRDAAETAPHEGHGAPAKALQVAFANTARAFSEPVPMDFRALSKTGCRTLNFGGHTVVEVCFPRGGVWLHCYIVRGADLADDAIRAGPAYATNGDMNSVSWSDGTYRYIVAGPVSRERLAEWL